MEDKNLYVCGQCGVVSMKYTETCGICLSNDIQEVPVDEEVDL